MSIAELKGRIDGVSVLSGEPLRMQGLKHSPPKPADHFSKENIVADLKGVTDGGGKRAAGSAEIPIRLPGILRRS
jgi:hypothetical protein